MCGPGWLVTAVQKVVNELGESLERERQREHASRTVLEGAVSKGGVILPEVCVTCYMVERDERHSYTNSKRSHVSGMPGTDNDEQTRSDNFF